MPHGKISKAALVTGASSGIGKATAFAFARDGYAVALADIDNAAGADVLKTLQDEGRQALFMQCDVADAAQVNALVHQCVATFGRLDVAFNNAGIEGVPAATADCTHENWDRVIGVNLTGVWLCMRAELKQMLQQPEGGAIVNCSSVAGIAGLPTVPAYVASKHGVIGLTRTAALEYATRNIRVNAVCPGAIETPMLERFMHGEQGRQQMIATEPVGRIGTPDEIAAAVVWLAGPAASFVTGHALAVDGGWTAR